MLSMKKKKSVAKVPYENYELPKSAEKGGSFIDFKRVIERKPVRKVKKIKKGVYKWIALYVNGNLQ